MDEGTNAAIHAGCDEPAATVEEELFEELVVEDGEDAAMPDVVVDAANVPLPKGDAADDDLQIMVKASMCYSTCPSAVVPKLRSGPQNEIV